MPATLTTTSALATGTAAAPWSSTSTASSPKTSRPTLNKSVNALDVHETDLLSWILAYSQRLTKVIAEAISDAICAI